MAPERWLALSVRPRAGVETDLLPLLLTELGGAGVEEAEGAFVTYLHPPADLDAFLALARERLAELGPPEQVELSWRWQPHEDWAVFWRKGLGPRRITPRLTVAPTWDLPAPEPGVCVLVLDPGMAFGTAEHASTRGCLRLMDPRVSAGDALADVGAGSGILSIAAALLGASRVLALESDELSCQVARENVAANGVGARVEVAHRLVQGDGPLPAAPYQGIVANLQRFLLLPLLAAFRESLTPGGWLILSGILLEEREEIVSAASREGLVLDGEDGEGEWWSGSFMLPSPGV